MTSTPDELPTLLEKLATTSKALAEAEQQRANADKVRAEAEKVRMEASADLEAKEIANQKARAEADAARIDKLIGQLTGAVPDLASVKKSTVTFSEGKVLRQGEAIGLALARVAAEIAHVVRDALANANKPVLFVTQDRKIIAILASYWQIKYEADQLKKRFDEAIIDAEESVHVPLTREFAPGTAVAVAAVAGKALTQVASLFEMEVSVATSDTSIPAQTLQAAVIGKLLELRPGLVVRHEWTRTLPPTSPLRTAIGGLIDLDITAAQLDVRLEARIKGLGDPAAKLAAAEKVAADKTKTDEEREDANRQASQARSDIQTLADLQDARNNLTAVVRKATAFAERITKVSDKTGDCLLTAALSVEPLAAEGESPYVLVLEGARAETHQLLITRRIFAPRLQVSTCVETDHFLVRGENMLACGHAAAAASYHGKITRSGAIWTRVEQLR